MLQRIISLIIKELLAVWRDKKSRVVLIAPPIIQLIVFSFAATLDVNNVAIGILNQDRGLISTDLIEKIKASHTFQKIYYLSSPEEVNKIIDNRKALVVLTIKQDFSKNLIDKKIAPVQLILDGRRSNASQIVQGYILNIVNNYNRSLNINNRMPVQDAVVISRHWFNPNLIYMWFTVPGLLGILTLIVGLIVTGLSVARERELGTFDQLLVSPLSPFEIVIGKTVPGLIIGLAEGTLMIVVAIYLFKIPFTGSLMLLYLSLFIYLISVIAFGLFISSISRTQQQAVLGAFVFSAPAILLSGFASPVENMPQWLQDLTIINPLRYFLVIARGLFLKDLPVAVVLENLIPLILISLFLMAGSAWFFRRRLE